MSDIQSRFSTALEEAARQPLRQALGEYGDALRSILRDMAALAEEPGPRPRTETGDEPTGGAADARAGLLPRERLAYVDRFTASFRPDLLDPADRARARLLSIVDGLPDTRVEVPDTITLEPVATGGPAPDAFIRPLLGQRLGGSLRSSKPREIPAGALVRVYLAQLGIRLEPMVSLAASLDSVALAAIRAEFHRRVDPPGQAEDPVLTADSSDPITATLAAAEAELDGALADIEDGLARAFAAPAVHIREHQAEGMVERGAERRGRLVTEWESFEAALHANTTSEAALAGALAALEAASARAVLELGAALDEHARDPLDRLAAGLSALARAAEARLELEDVRRSSDPEAVEALRAEAEELFQLELPHLDRLAEELADVAAAFVAALDRIPETVPADLRISERRILRVPEQPVRLDLREAPLAELLAASCRGALPRWVERTLAATADEIQALRKELGRVRNAVDFHIRAPLQGTFNPEEAAELVVGIMERSASQIADLRLEALDPVERAIPELERRSTAESNDVRRAVADREFLRIRSDIAEEEAVRRLSTGAAAARRLVGSGLALSRRGWSAGRRTFERTQEWAQRRLGVGTVEREEMLESLEESLLGEDRHRIRVPGLYRQLFDVEGEVPWEELLVARDDEIDTLRRALDRWGRGQSASVAVVGEKGSGKTTLLRMASRQLLGDVTVRTVPLASTGRSSHDLAGRIAAGLDVPGQSWGELTASIQKLGRTVIVVEDAQTMFLRALGGFAAVEAFLNLMAATREDVLWVVTSDEHAWRYLDHVQGIALHFTHTIKTTNLSAARLERAIMSRHDVSGFGLRFELEEDGLAAPTWWKRLRRNEPQGELTRRELERKTFFRQLNQIADGNIFLGLFHWLRSVDRVEDHVLVLRTPEVIALDFLERLPLASIHTIAGIILHGGLSEEEHRRIFQLDHAESRLQLAALVDAHLIFPSSQGEYRVNKVLYRPLVRLLEAKNIF